MPMIGHAITPSRVVFGSGAAGFLPSLLASNNLSIQADATIDQSAGNLAYYNGASGSQISALIDQSQQKAETGIYQANFSAGVDDWTFSDVGGAVDAPESIGGRSNVLKYTCNNAGGTGQKALLRNAVFNQAKVMRITFDYYIPGTNTNLKRISVRSADVFFRTTATVTPNTPDTWLTADYYLYIPAAGSTQVRIVSADAAGGTAYAGNGENFYIDNFKTVELAGNHFVQDIPADMALLTSGKIAFDGISDFYRKIGNNAEPYFSQSQGQFMAVYERVNGVSNNASLFTVGLLGSNIDDHILEHRQTGASGLGSDQFVYRTTIDNNSTQLKLPDGIKVLGSIGSNATRYKISIDNCPQVILEGGGSNSGVWFNAANPASDAVTIGRRMNTVFGRFNLEAMFNFNVELNPENEQRVFDFVNTEFNVWTDITDYSEITGQLSRLQADPFNIMSNLDAAGGGYFARQGGSQAARAIIDRSQNLAETLFYQSDFSGGVDGWAKTEASDTLTAPVSFGGFDNVLELTLGSATSQHQVNQTFAGILNNSLNKFEFEIFIPATNSALNSIQIRTTDGNSAITFNQGEIALNAWVNIPAYWFLGTNKVIDFRTLANGSPSFSAPGDKFYIRLVKIDAVAGNHWPNTTVAEQAATLSDAYSFDGVLDNLTAPDPENYRLKTVGTVYQISWNTSGSAQVWRSLSLSQLGSGTEYMHFGTPLTDNRPGVRHRISAVNNDYRVDSQENIRSDNKLQKISGDGSNYELSVSTVNGLAVVGTNIGLWFGALTTPANQDTLSLFSLLVASNLYYPGELRFQMILDNIPAVKNDLQIQKFINSQYNVFITP